VLLRTIGLMAVAFWFAGSAIGVEGDGPKTVGGNLVVNGGFEEGNEGWNRSLQTVDEPVHGGKKACVLDNSAGRPSVAIVRATRCSSVAWPNPSRRRANA